MTDFDDSFDVEVEEQPKPTYRPRTLAELQAERAAKLPKLKLSEKEFFALPPATQYQHQILEGDWVTIATSAIHVKTVWSPALEDAVMLGQPCPACAGNRCYIVLQRGRQTGAYRKLYPACLCQQLEWKRKVLSQPWAIPDKYTWANLATIQPSPKSRLSLSRQRKEIAFLRQHPDGSYLLCGPPGTSKTSYVYALLRAAYDRDWRYYWREELPRIEWSIKASWLWAVGFNTLMAQYLRKQGDRDAPEPDVTPEKIRAQAAKGHRPVLVIEEVDKLKLTEHRANTLFELVNAVILAKGQFVLTSNLTPAQFEEQFALSDSVALQTTGAPLMRRFEEENVFIRNYFEETQ